MTLEELIYKGTNTSGISNVSTRGQPKKVAIIGLNYMLIPKNKQ